MRVTVLVQHERAHHLQNHNMKMWDDLKKMYQKEHDAMGMSGNDKEMPMDNMKMMGDEKEMGEDSMNRTEDDKIMEEEIRRWGEETGKFMDLKSLEIDDEDMDEDQIRLWANEKEMEKDEKMGEKPGEMDMMGGEMSKDGMNPPDGHKKMFMGMVPCTVDSVSLTEIVCQLGEGPSGTYNFSVNVEDKGEAEHVDQQFTVTLTFLINETIPAAPEGSSAGKWYH